MSAGCLATCEVSMGTAIVFHLQNHAGSINLKVEILGVCVQVIHWYWIIIVLEEAATP
jgi:hypothetical protein